MEKPSFVFHFLHALYTGTIKHSSSPSQVMEKTQFAVSTLSPCIGACASALGLGVLFADHCPEGNLLSEKSNVGYKVCYQNRN